MEDAAAGAQSLVFRLLQSYCADHGLRLTAGDAHGHGALVENPAGKRWFFVGTRFDLNTLGCAEIASDKAYAAHFLKKSGIAVPAQCLVFSADIGGGTRSPEAVLSLAGERGFPLFVKPNSGQEGRDVVRVDNPKALHNALHILAKRHPKVLVQEEIRGRDIRVIVLDGEVLCAIERRAPRVTGDGQSRLAELIGSHPRIDPADSRIEYELSRQDLRMESVPAKGQIVSLLPVSNLSSGGSAEIVMESISSEVHAVARKSAAVLGLRYAGVDLVIPGNQRPGAAAVVLEVNAAPGLNHMYRQGKQAAGLVTEIYRKVFAAAFSD